MSSLIIFEDGKKMFYNNHREFLWHGLGSICHKNGAIIEYIGTLLMGTNSIMVIPLNDGNWVRTHPWWSDIQIYIDRAKKLKKVFILGTLGQRIEEPDINYVYLPLDDNFFEKGVYYFFSDFIEWKNKSEELIWRGGCSGYVHPSLRIRFVEHLYKNHPKIRLSTFWSEGKNINPQLFAPFIHYTEFLKYKIFFIVDGNVIASNHMWGFATNCVPIIISEAKCWFQEFAVDGVHYLSVKSDLSDLDLKLDWVKNNDKEAEQIARNAFIFAKNYFSSDFQKNYLKTKINALIA